MNSLVILLGPTGVGKTELSLRVAEHFGSPIISSDSRQLYKDLPIGTAAPTVEQMARVRHYMVGTLSLTNYYSASSFEEDVMSLLRELHQTHPTVVMTGGSMMYIDAGNKGVDDIPAVAGGIGGGGGGQVGEGGRSAGRGEVRGAGAGAAASAGVADRWYYYSIPFCKNRPYFIRRPPSSVPSPSALPHQASRAPHSRQPHTRRGRQRSVPT